MYGIIHNAVRSAVLLQAGETVWADVMAKAGLTDQHFLSPANYSDEVTLRLIDTVGVALGLSRAETMRVAGDHWCDYAVSAGYSSVFSMAGSSLGEFLSNLDRMHSSLNVALPEAVMPSFELVHADEGRYELIYRSHRKGFETFVEGILQGLFRHYGEAIEMSWTQQSDSARFFMTRVASSDTPVSSNNRAVGRDESSTASTDKAA